MTDTRIFTPMVASPEPAHTIFRDTAFADAPFTAPSLYATDDSDQITPLIHLGLAALLLPTFAYAASVLVGLFTSGNLERAIRAFFI